MVLLVTLPLLLIVELVDRGETARIKRKFLERSTWKKSKRKRE